MADHRFVVTVSGCTAEQAEQVMSERINVDEDYGFEYTIGWEGTAPTGYVVGAPDTTPNGGGYCGEMDDNFVCTREPDGHSQHAAGNGYTIAHVWGEPDAS